jgi:hypothetical protein
VHTALDFVILERPVSLKEFSSPISFKEFSGRPEFSHGRHQHDIAC